MNYLTDYLVSRESITFQWQESCVNMVYSYTENYVRRGVEIFNNELYVSEGLVLCFEFVSF